MYSIEAVGVDIWGSEVISVRGVVVYQNAAQGLEREPRSLPFRVQVGERGRGGPIVIADRGYAEPVAADGGIESGVWYDDSGVGLPVIKPS